MTPLKAKYEALEDRFKLWMAYNINVKRKYSQIHSKFIYENVYKLNWAGTKADIRSYNLLLAINRPFMLHI